MTAPSIGFPNVGHDGEVPLVEAELLRAIADSFDCPIPLTLIERESAIE